MKRIFSILFAVVLVLSLSLVTAVPVAAQDGVPDRVTAITRTADRLVALQGTDDGWDGDVTGLTAHSGSYPSPANLFGVTALGLIDAYEVTGNTAYSTAAENTGDHLKTLSRAIDSTVRIQTFDYRFLVEFSALSGDPSYQGHALSEWNWVKANVASFYADGNQETIYNFWSTSGGATHGFAAWQAADGGLAALVMGDTSWAGNMATVLAGHLNEITGTDIYRFIGWGHALEFLNAVDSVAYSTEITSLISNLTGSQNADGSWPGTTVQGTVQNTAYAVMGLAAVGEGDAARKGASWLVANQISTGNSIGGWIETDSQEYSFVDSEALQALAAVPMGIVALWHLDGNADDSSAYDNDGTVYGGASYVSGKFDQALSFDGTDDYVEVAHADSLDMTSAYTIEAWVNVTDVPSNIYRPIVFRGTTNANDIEVYVQAISDDLVVAHNRGNGGTFDWVRFADPPIGTLFHLVVTFDGTNVQVYYNGIAATVNQRTTAMVAPLDTDKDWWIGKVDHTAFGTLSGGSPINLFKGLIDEVRIWNVALTAAQVAQSASLGDLEFTKELESAVGDLSGPVDTDAVPLGENITFTMEIEVDNTLTDLTLNDVAVKDRLGAELELDEEDLTPSTGTASYTTKGKSAKVFIDWDVGTTLGAATATLGIEANTDYNPGGGKKAPHQEYSSPGDYELNSGATLTFSVTIAGEEICLVLTTDPISVTVVGVEDEDDDLL